MEYSEISSPQIKIRNNWQFIDKNAILGVLVGRRRRPTVEKFSISSSNIPFKYNHFRKCFTRAWYGKYQTIHWMHKNWEKSINYWRKRPLKREGDDAIVDVASQPRPVTITARKESLWFMSEFWIKYQN